MYNPDFKTVENLSKTKQSFKEFEENFISNCDLENELDAQLKVMINLITEGLDSVYEEMKRRL